MTTASCGRAERGDGALRVDLVAAAEVLKHHLLGYRCSVADELGVAAARALLGRGVEIDLEVGVGQDDGADIAAGHHDRVLAGEVALLAHERLADAGDPRDERDVLLDLGGAQAIGDVDAVDGDAGRLVGAGRREGDVDM